MVTTNRSSSKTEKCNALRAVLAYTFRTAALLCSTGPLMQTFLSSIGFSEQQIYMHATLFQAVNVITILLCSRFADTKKVLLRTALIQIPGAILFLGYLPLCLSRNVSADTVKDSVIFANTVIGEGSTVNYSIIDEKVTIGNNVVIGIEKSDSAEIAVVGRGVKVYDNAVVAAGANIEEDVHVEKEVK